MGVLVSVLDMDPIVNANLLGGVDPAQGAPLFTMAKKNTKIMFTTILLTDTVMGGLNCF